MKTSLVILIALVTLSVTSLDILKECTTECTQLTFDALSLAFFDRGHIKEIEECKEECSRGCDSDTEVHYLIDDVIVHRRKKCEDSCKRSCVINDIYKTCEKICADIIMGV